MERDYPREGSNLRSAETTEAIIGAAIDVHSELGPGLLESVYEACLAHELNARGMEFERQLPVPVSYKGIRLDCGFRLDLFVAREVILEVKAVDMLAPVHEAQLLTYLRLARCSVGLLINFNARSIKEGLMRRVL